MAFPRRTVSTPTKPSTTSEPLSSPQGDGQQPPRTGIQRVNSEPIKNSDGHYSTTSSLGVIQHIKFSERKFDTTTLPADLQRVYHQLVEDHDEQYALAFVFLVRTAIELHRAWHMTLLTSRILQLVKSTFGLHCTWNLGVVKLIFRVDDGGFELHRKVPYDYDSEFQDLYMKMAHALCEGHISIHDALIYQSETKQGLHTAPSGLFLRDNPGRLLLYPLESATCAVIFFGGDWMDGAVAAICGFGAGSMEWILSLTSSYFGTGEVKILIDIVAGLVTGVVGGLFYRFYHNETFCLSAIFLGTLYWFFYGTAFVLGLLEIIAGELETGVTRFIAVSIKTFVLSMSAAIGLMIAVGAENSNVTVYEAWHGQFNTGCNTIDLGQQWWRIPLYLLCSASALGQYRFPIANYWRGLIVQLVGYEVQYRTINYMKPKHEHDNLDTAVSNVCGAAAAVLAAWMLRYFVDETNRYYTAALLNQKLPDSLVGKVLYNSKILFMQFVNTVGLGRKTQRTQIELQSVLRRNVQEIRDPDHSRQQITLTPTEEKALTEAIVEAHGLNLWSLLMPAVYQLVPGSMIAKLWFNAIFPPPLAGIDEPRQVGGTKKSDGLTYIDTHTNTEADDVFYGLMVTSLSLALGLIIGSAITSAISVIFRMIRDVVRPINRFETPEEKLNRKRREKLLHGGVTAFDDSQAAMENDPDGGGGQTDKKTDEPIQPFYMSRRNINLAKMLQEEEDGDEETAPTTRTTGTTNNNGGGNNNNVPLSSQTTATTYIMSPNSERGMIGESASSSSSVRIRPLNQGVLVPLNEENDNADDGDDEDEESAPAMKVQMMNSKAENDEGFEVSSPASSSDGKANSHHVDEEDHA